MSVESCFAVPARLVTVTLLLQLGLLGWSGAASAAPEFAVGADPASGEREPSVSVPSTGDSEDREQGGNEDAQSRESTAEGQRLAKVQADRKKVGRALVGVTVGVQAAIVGFGAVSRLVSLGGAPSISIGVEIPLMLGSPVLVPLGILGFERLSDDPLKGRGFGLLEGGLYALGTALLHGTYVGVSSTLDSGGQGGDIVSSIVGPIIIISHASLGIAMTIAGAATLGLARRSTPAGGVSSRRHRAKRAAVVVLPWGTGRSGGVLAGGYF